MQGNTYHVEKTQQQTDKTQTINTHQVIRKMGNTREHRWNSLGTRDKTRDQDKGSKITHMAQEMRD